MRKLALALAALLIPFLPLAASAHDHDGWHEHGRGEWHEGWHGDRDWHHHWHGGYYAAGVYYPAGYAPYYVPAAPVMVAPQPVYYAAPPILSFGFSLGH